MYHCREYVSVEAVHCKYLNIIELPEDTRNPIPFSRMFKKRDSHRDVHDMVTHSAEKNAKRNSCGSRSTPLCWRSNASSCSCHDLKDDGTLHLFAAKICLV